MGGKWDRFKRQNGEAWGMGVRGDGEMVEYCQWEPFKPECSRDEVVVIEAALYGRMRLGRCLRNGEVGCSRDVKHLVERRCGGRRSCRVDVPDQMFDETMPCEENLKSYLMVAHRCVKGG